MDPDPDDLDPHDDAAPPPQLIGVELRYYLALLLHEARCTLSARQLADAVEADGFAFRPGRRPAKVVADSMRAEVNLGRAVRVAPGRYRTGGLSKQSLSRFRRRIQARRAAIALGHPTSHLPMHLVAGAVARAQDEQAARTAALVRAARPSEHPPAA